MKCLRLLAALPALMLVLAVLHPAAAQRPLDPENTLVITLKDGDVVARLFPQIAPQTVERIKTLAREGFYDGIVFHRVIDGFMAQTGDPTGTGTGGSDYPDLPAEFSGLQHRRGTLSMARTADPDSANSQFFIVFDRAPHLDGEYTIFGQVVEGMEFVDMIQRGHPMRNGAVANPDAMIRVRVMADIEQE